jgi:hypothetical protein
MPASFTSITYLTVVGAGLSLSFSRRSTPIFALKSARNHGRRLDVSRAWPYSPRP